MSRRNRNRTPLWESESFGNLFEAWHVSVESDRDGPLVAIPRQKPHAPRLHCGRIMTAGVYGFLGVLGVVAVAFAYRLRIPRMPAGDSSRCRASVPGHAGPGMSRTLLLSSSS
jgi:hypothetical protein